MIESPLLQHVQGYVAGKWRGGSGNASIDVVNPATAALLAKVPEMVALEAGAAIDSADLAMRNPVKVEQRMKWLTRIADLLLEYT